LPDGGQVCGNRQVAVVEAHDCDIARNAQAKGSCGKQGANRKKVVMSHDDRRSGIALKQAKRRRPGLLDRVPTDLDSDIATATGRNVLEPDQSPQGL
jgi:hypothetical protein